PNEIMDGILLQDIIDFSKDVKHDYGRGIRVLNSVEESLNTNAPNSSTTNVGRTGFNDYEWFKNKNLVFPTTGRIISSPWGNRKDKVNDSGGTNLTGPHPGDDIAECVGSKVFSCLDGTVYCSVWWSP